MRDLRQTIPGAGECILQNMKIKLVQTKRSKMFVFATAHDVFTNNTKFSSPGRAESCLHCSVQQTVG